MSAHSRPPSNGRCALLTLGRLPVALEIARALHADGWRVIVAEPLRWHLCRLSRAVARSVVVTAPTVDAARYLRELRAVIDAEGVTLVVPVSEETPFVAGLHGRLPADVVVACAPRDALLQLHDKWRFATLARSLGLPVPATALASSSDAVRLAASGPHVIKPRLSCSGVGVRQVTGGATLPEALRDERYVVQRRLSGEALCAAAFVRAGAVTALVTYRSLLEAGSVSVSFERVPTPPGIAGFVATLAAARGSSGMLAFDFMADERGCFRAIECNPRATSGLHLMAPSTIAAGLAPTAADSDSPSCDEGEGSTLLPLGTRRQEFWSALLEVEGRTLRGRGRREDWRRLLGTRDVDWSATDRKPSLLLVPASAPLMWRALRARRPIVEVTMADVGWHGPR